MLLLEACQETQKCHPLIFPLPSALQDAHMAGTFLLSQERKNISRCQQEPEPTVLVSYPRFAQRNQNLLSSKYPLLYLSVHRDTVPWRDDSVAQGTCFATMPIEEVPSKHSSSSSPSVGNCLLKQVSWHKISM